MISESPLANFHPAVAQWFEAALGQPTEPQRRGWPAIQSGQDTLIAAPTGSGKTLAAFLAAIDSLVRQGVEGSLRDETQVIYISPLKALSNDVKQNLTVPLSGVQKVLWNKGLLAPEIRAWVRTGDTPAAERQKMLRKPPHILVTTPESLFILLTAEKSRQVLRTVRTVIVDEIHAVARDKRGSHLTLTLERLDALANTRPVRIGLSATQKPIDEVARFLVGTERLDENGKPRCTIIDVGHARPMDLAIEVPPAPLSAVCSNEDWEQVYDRLARLIEAERTTLVFVNTRRLAERLAMHLSKRLGEDQVTSHHGSLSRHQRLRAEQRLKSGQLRALVATASLELGIDIGTVDLVCQIGSPHAISIFLQRAGRSGHTLGAVPRARMFALTRDELIECAALLRAVRQKKLDCLVIPEKPLDILTQQIVAAASTEPLRGWDENELYRLCRAAYPYRNLSREEFDQAVQMLNDGFSTRRGRSGAHVRYDGIGKRIRPRKGARLAAITSGGAIPDTADYQVVLEPDGLFLGTINEDFAIESLAGDIFLLGNASWKILRVETGIVRVEDAHGAPPTLPFWLGEAPARTRELSEEVSDLREEVEKRLDSPAAASQWLQEEAGLTAPQADQITAYLDAARQVLGAVPTQKTIVLERFFDASGGMQLVVHSPFGGRINRAWGLALRKRFCRSFNFELQAAATEDSIVLSLGLQHSFPLEDVFAFLSSHSVEPLLVQALLAAPMFPTRWRWNSTRALAILRQAGGKRVPPALLRMKADDLLAAVFPDSAACAENLTGPIEIPDHPLVRQTIADCLNEAMDIEGFISLLKSIEEGKIRLLARDTLEPSPLADEILNARPYSFLDDAPLEERRTRAAQTRRSLDSRLGEEGILDSQAIAAVREQAWPQVEDSEDLHDALLLTGFVGDCEQPDWEPYFRLLASELRAARLNTGSGAMLWIAAERKPQFDCVYPDAVYEPAIVAPERELAQAWKREDALREIVRGRLETLGPVTPETVGRSMSLPEDQIQLAMLALEKEGFVIRGHFTQSAKTEWCDRRLLARIHRATLDRLHREIEPVTATDFLRFLFIWQHADPDCRVDGPLGLSAVVEMLQGFEVPAAAWEESVLPSRVKGYDGAWLDQLCLSGELAWMRLFPPTSANGNSHAANRVSPICLLFRGRMEKWLMLSAAQTRSENGHGNGHPKGHGNGHGNGHAPVGAGAQRLLEVLKRKGACFFQDLVSGSGLLRTEVENALRELISTGWVTGDGFAGLRALVIAPGKTLGTSLSKHKDGRPGVLPVLSPTAGRWSLVNREERSVSDDQNGASTAGGNFLNQAPSSAMEASRDGAAESGSASSVDPGWDSTELAARQLLHRYGVVFHRLVCPPASRETGLPPWRELLRCYRRMEARGEIRGGRFVSGFSGEQYALPEAVQQLRASRRSEPGGHWVVLSAADPLNLAGVITAGRKIAATAGNRILFRDGLPIAAREAGELIELDRSVPELRSEINALLPE